MDFKVPPPLALEFCDEPSVVFALLLREIYLLEEQHHSAQNRLTLLPFGALAHKQVDQSNGANAR